VAIYGKWLSKPQLFLLARRVGKDGIRVVLDASAKRNAIRIAEMFMRHDPPIPSGVVFLPGEETDPDDMPQAQLQNLLLSCGTLDETGLDLLRLELT
jgi:hypothetical protein